jgi:hypothetical protein
MDEPFRSQLANLWEELHSIEDQIRAIDDLGDEDAVDLYGEFGRVSKTASSLQNELKEHLRAGVRGGAFHVQEKRRIWRTYNFGGLMRLANDHGLTFQDLWLDGYLKIVMSAKGFTEFLDRVGIPMDVAMAKQPFEDEETISAGPAKAHFVRADPDEGLVWIDQLEPQLVVLPNARSAVAQVTQPPPVSYKRSHAYRGPVEEPVEEEAVDEELYDDDWQTLAKEISRDLADDADEFARSNSEGWFYED